MADNLPVQRRLAAILAADVAGYSRLMGADEEGTLARLKALRAGVIDPTIARHNGRIVKTTGDGLLVEFASVVDAMRGAIEWQNAMAERADTRIKWRIGVNLGDIIIDDGADPDAGKTRFPGRGSRRSGIEEHRPAGPCLPRWSAGVPRAKPPPQPSPACGGGRSAERRPGRKPSPACGGGKGGGG